MVEAMESEKKYEAVHRQVLADLKKAIGEENASDNEAVRASYRGGTVGVWTWPPLPDFVCRPKSVEHVQSILAIANKYKIPVTPIASGMMLPWIFPMSRGIVIDTMGMDRILEISIPNGYALVEPGVTFNQLLAELKKVGHMVPAGSFPGTVSVLGNIVAHKTPGLNVGINATHAVGVEVVLPNGEIVRTGTATFGTNYWSDYSYFTPDLKGLFSPSIGTMGVITKAAVRIYPRFEVQALPIAVFDNFNSAFDYCRTVVRGLLAYQSMAYHWKMLPYLQWAHADIPITKFMEIMQLRKGPKDMPKGYSYDYCTTHIMGYKEQVEGNIKTCVRLAKELGGQLLMQEEFASKFPGVWAEWKGAYMDHETEKIYLKGTAFGSIDTLVFVGDVDSLKRMESVMFEKLKDYNIDSITYYSRMVDQGRYAHLRFMTLSDNIDERQIDETIKMRDELMEWLRKNYPSVMLIPPAETIGTTKLMGKIKDVIDPNNIMNPYWRGKMPFG